jgi:hypothetical protein
MLKFRIPPIVKTILLKKIQLERSAQDEMFKYKILLEMKLLNFSNYSRFGQEKSIKYFIFQSE